MNDTLLTELIAAHKTCKDTLDKAKDKERKLRDKIVAELFPSPKRGTNKADLKNIGLHIKAVIKDYWSVKQEGMDELLCENESIQKAFKYKYDLVMAGYKELTDAEKILLAENVTCKDAAPELSYEGELPYPYITDLKVKDGVLWLNNVMVTVENADKAAKHYGFQYAEELVKFLEKIQ